MPRVASAATARSRSTAAQAGVAVDVPTSRERVETALANDYDAVDLVDHVAPARCTDDQLRPAHDQLIDCLRRPAVPLTSNGETVRQLGRSDLPRC